MAKVRTIGLGVVFCLLVMFELPAARADEKQCPSPGPVRRVAAAEIETMINAGQPVRLEGVIITGRELNLSRQIVKERFVLKNSVIETSLWAVDAAFMADVDMSGSVFHGVVHVDRALFNKDAVWRCARFMAPFSHHTTTVNGSMVFDDARFAKPAGFSRTRVGHAAHFTRTVFNDSANFIGLRVEYSVVFEGTRFARGAIFERVDIGESAWFRERPTEHGVIPGAQFLGGVSFKGARVGGQAEFSGTVFRGEVRMGGVRFNEALFRRTHFVAGRTKEDNEVGFDDADFGSLDFGGGEWRARFDPERRVRMAGMKYRELKSPHFMLRLLEKLDPYHRDPYAALERFWRNAGEQDRANAVYYARRTAEGNGLRLREQPVRWAWDRLLRRVFGYGVALEVPVYWIVGLVAATAVLLSGRGALTSRDGSVPPRKRGWRARMARPLIALGLSLNVLIPRLRLFRVRDWRVSEEPITAMHVRLPFTYAQATSFMKYISWGIITVALSVFSVGDLVKN